MKNSFAPGWCALALAALAPAAVQAAPLNADKPLVPGDEYLVVASNPDNLHVVDLKADALYKSCAVPGSVAPGTMVMSPDKTTAYLVTNHFDEVHGIALDTCQVVFHAKMAQKPEERAKALFALSVSNDSKQLYVIQTPTTLHSDHYRIGEPRLAVYDAKAGEGAKPLRTLPAPRQVTVMATGHDGSLYMVGPDIYKFDPVTGKQTVAIPSRNWKRPHFAPPDVLSVWPMKNANDDFTILYTTAKFKGKDGDMANAEFLYGYFNVNLKTGKTETRDFAPFTEIYFTGTRSPKDPNLMFGVLNRLAKYDIKQKKLLKAAEIPYSHYTVSMNREGSKVYLGGTWNNLTVYDAAELKPVTTIALPGGDMGAASPQTFTR
ncbi:quinohemoprotein amine dehydrogenase subunit beta [Hydrogenophaga sp. RWCD_12]|uniref:quinohemoprotein amine dehydrogenase subunit beta n=1 Tax=Hydrogenophaga sp. RWCD_12 TaxID=3391190 RepID=UPI003984B589